MLLRLLPLPFIALALLAGITGGWIRMGWDLTLVSAAANHGILMTGGMLGTLIVLERTVTMPAPWWRAFPLSCAVGTVLLLVGYTSAGLSAMLLGNAGLVALYLMQMRHHREAYWHILLAGALSWGIGTALVWQGAPILAAAPWWITFLLFTIVGERLELTRYLPVPRIAKVLLWVLLALYFAGLLLPFHGTGRLLLGVSTTAIALWLLRYVMARKGVRKPGMHRYVGGGLLIGHTWLLVHGLITLLAGTHPFYYDLYLHTFFLGFTFSMVWAHAPIILPGVLRSPHNPFLPWLWTPWALFQITLLGRIVSTLAVAVEARRFFGLLNGMAMLGMFACMAVIMVWKTRRAGRFAAL